MLFWMEGYHLLSVPVDFRIALSRILFSHHVFVQLSEGRHTGTGEGILYRATPYQAACLLRHSQADNWTEQIRHWATISPAVAYAMDTAWWDLRGHNEGKPLSTMLGGAKRCQVDVTEQVFIHDWNTAEAELDTILAHGTRRLKIKIGVNPTADLGAVRHVRAFVGPNIELRVDANHAYSFDDSKLLYHHLADLGILAFEEPLHLRDWPRLRALREHLGIPIILDESILSLDDLRAAIAGQALDVLNVKLTRVGGITLAHEYIALCQQHGIGVVIGCAEDLGIGTAAIVHLATSLDNCHIEGIGPLRLGFDVVTPDWTVQNGTLQIPDGPGLGVTLRKDWRAHIPKQVRQFGLMRPTPKMWAFSHYSRFLQRAENVRLRVARRLS